MLTDFLVLFLLKTDVPAGNNASQAIVLYRKDLRRALRRINRETNSVEYLVPRHLLRGQQTPPEFDHTSESSPDFVVDFFSSLISSFQSDQKSSPTRRKESVLERIETADGEDSDQEVVPVLSSGQSKLSLNRWRYLFSSSFSFNFILSYLFFLILLRPLLFALIL